MIVLVKDANGARATVGLSYAQYEFTEPLGGKRLTDEQWQEHFYKGTDENVPYEYTSLSQWPAINSWYAPLFGGK